MLDDLGGMGFATTDSQAEACEEAAETATEAEASSNKAPAPSASEAPASDWQPDVFIDDGMPCCTGSDGTMLFGTFVDEPSADGMAMAKFPGHPRWRYQAWCL